MEEETKTINTEGPTSGESHPAGGVDKARDAAREREAGGDAAVDTEATADTAAEEITDTAEVKDAQDQVDDMVDFTVTEASLAELNANLPDGAPALVVGGTVKLAKDHPLLTAQA